MDMANRGGVPRVSPSRIQKVIKSVKAKFEKGDSQQTPREERRGACKGVLLQTWSKGTPGAMRRDQSYHFMGPGKGDGGGGSR